VWCVVQVPVRLSQVLLDPEQTAADGVHAVSEALLTHLLLQASMLTPTRASDSMQSAAISVKPVLTSEDDVQRLTADICKQLGSLLHKAPALLLLQAAEVQQQQQLVSGTCAVRLPCCSMCRIWPAGDSLLALAGPMLRLLLSSVVRAVAGPTYGRAGATGAGGGRLELAAAQLLGCILCSGQLAAEPEVAAAGHRHEAAGLRL
jgi:hypothetical protein